MRHLGSLLLSIVLTPVIYVLTGIGLIKLLIGFETLDTRLTPRTAGGILALLAAGALYAVLVQARLSPVGPVIAGLAFLVFGLMAVLRPQDVQLPHSVLGVRDALQQPGGGITLLLAPPLLLTVVSPRRWRRYAWPRPAAAPSSGFGQPDAGYPPPPPVWPADPPASQTTAPQQEPAGAGPSPEESTLRLPHDPSADPPGETERTTRL